MRNFYSSVLLCLAAMLGSGAVLLPQHAMAASDIEKNMKQMKQAYRKALKADNMADFAGYVAELKQKTQAAAQYTYKPGNAKLSNVYKQGLQQLNTLYAELDVAIKAGDLNQAKAVLEKIKQAERKYHTQLKV